MVTSGKSEFTELEQVRELVIESVRKKQSLTVRELFVEVSTSSKLYSIDEFIESLKQLEADGKIDMKDTLPSSTSFSRYIINPSFSIKFWVVLLFTCFELITVYAFPANAPWSYLRLATGLFFLLYLPGFAITEVFFKKEHGLDGVEKIALGIALSLVSVIFVGILLNFTPARLTLDPIALSMSCFVIAFMSIASYREYKSLLGNRLDASHDR